MFANLPETAKKWAKETRGSLPNKVMSKKLKSGLEKHGLSRNYSK